MRILNISLLQVDSEGVHIPGSEAVCPSSCPSTNCPIGFWPHLKTCIQVSASTPEDSPASVEEAETSCVSQGGRLYQPRSTRSLQLLQRRSPEFFKSGNSGGTGILSWDTTSKAAFGKAPQCRAFGASPIFLFSEESMFRGSPVGQEG